MQTWQEISKQGTPNWGDQGHCRGQYNYDATDVKYPSTPGVFSRNVTDYMLLHTCRIDANRPLSVYKEERPLPNQSLDGVRNKENSTSWRTLPTQADRNKENSMMPTKWTSHKVLLPGHSDSLK